MVVQPTVKVSLDGLVCAVCVADHNGKLLFDHAVDSAADLCVQPRYSARTSDKDFCHDQFWVRVIARAKTSDASPLSYRTEATAFMVAPDWYRSSNKSTFFFETSAGSTE